MILWAFSMSTAGRGMHFSHVVNLGRRQSNKMQYDSDPSDVTEKNNITGCFKRESSIKRRSQQKHIFFLEKHKGWWCIIGEED